MVEMDTIVSLCKRRGFIFQSSEIYGGTGSCWDYGPLGSELKSNLKRAWWRDTVQLRSDMVGLDASILMHPKVWQASGLRRALREGESASSETRSGLLATARSSRQLR